MQCTLQKKEIDPLYVSVWPISFIETKSYNLHKNLGIFYD